jgi:outer membrane protein OmpA-like peptidoglycan-associated protein
MAQIFNALKSLIDPELGKAAAALGEPESKISSASHTILGGLLARMASHGSRDGLSTALKMAGQSTILNDLPKIFAGKDTDCEENTTNNFLKILLGEKAGPFNSNIASASGIGRGNASRLTAMIGSAVSAFLGKQLHDGTSTTDLVKELDKEKSGFLSVIPASVGSALGLSAAHHETHHEAHHAAHPAAHPAAHHETRHAARPATANTGKKKHTVHRMLTEEDEKIYAPEKKKGLGWLLWLLLAIVLLLLLIFGWRSCHRKRIVAPVAAPVALVTPPVAPPVGLFELVLPDGVKLNVRHGGMEDKMVQFLLSDTYKNGTDAELRNHWFEFEDVDFVRGSASEFMDKTTAETRLHNVAAILKAFPEADIRIGGFADKTGTPGYNLELSRQRAVFIDKHLDGHDGIDPHRMITEGFGEEYANFPATASAEEAASDRDIAFRFYK